MYPIMLSLAGRRCLVVGGGGVALRKVLGLLAEDATVRVVAPETEPGMDKLESEGRITLERRPYRSGEAGDGYWLVFAATDVREVNEEIFADAEKAGVWANIADVPDLCSFHLPGRVRRGSLEIAIASGGHAPFLTRRLRQVFEERIGPEWSEWIDAAARLRLRAKEEIASPPDEEHVYDRFFESTFDSRRLAVRVPGDAEVDRWFAGDEQAREALPRPQRRAVSREGRAPGLVSLVGSGPGNPGLITVWGRRRLFEADAVVFDRLALPALPSDLPPRVKLHAVGKTAGNHTVPQNEITATLVRLAREGKRVVRLKGGDPYVFGRGGEEAEILAAENIPFEVIPGVTSGVAAPAFFGIPVTHRRESVQVTLVTAHEAIKTDGPQVRWDLLAQDPNATIVGYMGVTALPGVLSNLLAYGMDPNTPAALIERGTTALQKAAIATVSTLVEEAARKGIKPPALFVIGPTVEHAERLDWTASLPLGGERLALPFARRGLIASLERLGADVVGLPQPMTEAARLALNSLPVTGVVVGSAGEVDAIDEERGGAGFKEWVVSWCLDADSAERATERGWQWIETIDEVSDYDQIAEEIARRRS